MFEGFENMVKQKISSLKQSSSSQDVTRSAQTYQINGKTIREIKLLSEGSFGFIWLAEDIATKQKYALKRIVCINNERFRLAKNELDLMMRFPKSKNIVACFGGEIVTVRTGNGAENKMFIILMEYCPNGTLFELLEKRENKGFAEQQLLMIAYSILQGLKNIHATGVYHQDVKIENVLVGEDKAFKLCDFGSCSNRFIDLASTSKAQYSHIKEEIEAVTTPMYRPPEVVDPYLQYQIGFKVDVWMLGCVLYTLAYFTHPFLDANAVGIAAGTYRFPKYPNQTNYQVSDKIQDLIRNLLTPNPAFRPSVAQAMQLIANWSSLPTIPLNREAARRRLQEKEKEKQLQVLYKKVVDFDGDIPMEKLMVLQQRLKSAKEEEVPQTKTFVTAKTQIKTINQSKPLFMNSSQPQPPQQSKKQDSVTANSFWTTPSSTAPKSNKVVGFDDFFSKPSAPVASPAPVAPKPTQNDIYDFFFPVQESNAPAKMAPKKENETNLLDL